MTNDATALTSAAKRIAICALTGAITAIGLIVISIMVLPPGPVRYWIAVALGIAGSVSVTIALLACFAMYAREHWQVALSAVVGVAVAHSLGALVNTSMSPGVVRVVVYSVVFAIGLALIGFVVWTRSRSMAGDERRPQLVAVLAFLALPQGQWLSILPLDDHYMQISAQFALTFAAFCFAMLVYKRLAPIDAHEAKQRRAELGDVA